MTEIQWLVDLMLNHKLPEAVKQKVIARIGEVEASLTKAPTPQAIQPIRASRVFTPADLEPSSVTLTPPPPPPVARKIVPQEVVVESRGTTSIRGPRKF